MLSSFSPFYHPFITMSTDWFYHVHRSFHSISSPFYHHFITNSRIFPYISKKILRHPIFLVPKFHIFPYISIYFPAFWVPKLHPYFSQPPGSSPYRARATHRPGLGSAWTPWPWWRWSNRPRWLVSWGIIKDKAMENIGLIWLNMG